MEWRDDGIVVGVRRHGETSVILDLLTRHHGRHLGLVHGGRSRRLRPCLQAGNAVDALWRSRIEEQLGTFSIEARTLRAARMMESGLALNALNHLCTLARLLPEREPHQPLHDRLSGILDAIDDRFDTPAAIVRFELELLSDLGFGLDLGSCAATGSREDLVFVSPKSGRAVCREAGEPYRAQMLPLPAFLLGQDGATSADDIAAGFRLAEHFLLRDIFLPRGLALTAARSSYVKALTADEPVPGRAVRDPGVS